MSDQIRFQTWGIYIIGPSAIMIFAHTPLFQRPVHGGELLAAMS